MALKGGAVVPINRQKPEAQSELPAGYPAGGGKALFTDPSLAPARPKKASMTNCRGQEEFFLNPLLSCSGHLPSQFGSLEGLILFNEPHWPGPAGAAAQNPRSWESSRTLAHHRLCVTGHRWGAVAHPQETEKEQGQCRSMKVGWGHLDPHRGAGCVY